MISNCVGTHSLATNKKENIDWVLRGGQQIYGTIVVYDSNLLGAGVWAFVENFILPKFVVSKLIRIVSSC